MQTVCFALSGSSTLKAGNHHPCTSRQLPQCRYWGALLTTTINGLYVSKKDPQRRHIRRHILQHPQQCSTERKPCTPGSAALQPSWQQCPVHCCQLAGLRAVPTCGPNALQHGSFTRRGLTHTQPVQRIYLCPHVRHTGQPLEP